MKQIKTRYVLIHLTSTNFLNEMSNFEPYLVMKNASLSLNYLLLFFSFLALVSLG